MKVTLLGCGHMGRGAGFALAADPRVTELTVVDRDADRAGALAAQLAGRSAARVLAGSAGLTGSVGSAGADPGAAIAGRDVVAMALPWSATSALIPVAVAAGVPVVSITRPPTADLAGLGAMARGGRVLLPLGLEPGLTELLAVHVAAAAARHGRLRAVSIACGGVPAAPREPLGYTVFFGGENDDHLPIAQRDSLALLAGEPVRLPRFSGVEPCAVDGVGMLEAYHDGMVPWLAEHPLLRSVDCTQKTLRWPGFADTVTGLARLGLLDEQPVTVDGATVVPRRVVERVLAPRLRALPGESDIVVLEVTARADTATGPVVLRGRLVDRHDPDTGLSAMARTTGGALAAGAALLADGAVTGTGWLRPHLSLTAEHVERVLAALRANGTAWTPPRGEPDRPAAAARPAAAGPAARPEFPPVESGARGDGA